MKCMYVGRDDTKPTSLCHIL